MNVDTCIKYAKELLEYSSNMLVIRIGEINKKHMNNEPLTDKEKFIIGLRYSEFLAEGNSDTDYYQASLKRDACLNRLGISMNWLIDQCKLVCDLF